MLRKINLLNKPSFIDRVGGDNFLKVSIIWAGTDQERKVGLKNPASMATSKATAPLMKKRKKRSSSRTNASYSRLSTPN